MKGDVLNQAMREMFLDLVNEGYKKHPMCEVTLGTSASPQFENFLKGEPLGVKPLGRMIEGLKCELHLVPVMSTDEETLKTINETTEKFIAESRKYLIDFIDNRPLSGRSTTGKTKIAFSEQVNEMFDEI